MMVTSPVAMGALVGLAPPKSYKSPKIEIWDSVECLWKFIMSVPLHERSLPIEDLAMILLVTNKGKE